MWVGRDEKKNDCYSGDDQRNRPEIVRRLTSTIGVAARTSGRGPVLIVSRKASAYVISGLLCSILATAHV